MIEYQWRVMSQRSKQHGAWRRHAVVPDSGRRQTALCGVKPPVTAQWVDSVECEPCRCCERRVHVKRLVVQL
jgi:hypothetical protein